MNAAIVGCGLIGQKRAESMPSRVRLVGCFDTDREKRERFAQKYQCCPYESFNQMLQDETISFIIIATQHNVLAELAKECLRSNKSVFLEKPGAIRSKDLRSIAEIARVSGKKLHIGYNHQFHPAIQETTSMALQGEIGSLMYMRARYGHGGRIGYENEWRARKEISGGGELIDQGAHLIEIALKLFGDLKVDYATTPTFFWDMSVEDNVFMILKDENGRVVQLHASCTEWKNLFSLEVYGTKGKIEVNGLGRSYGVETLTVYHMLPKMGPPDTEFYEFRDPDNSWALELEQFTQDIENCTDYSDNLDSSIRVLEIIEEIYTRTER